jgi:DNA-3-methyladenine glycosylase II
MLDEAVDHLKRVDPVLGKLIDRVGQRPPGPRTHGTHLGAIARAIVYQQLSGKAAGTIHGRFEGLFGGRAPTAQELLATRDEDLRAVGLSRAKAIYLKDLAARAVSGALPVDDLHHLDDERLLEALTAVKGIGRWTAQMFLMFRLGRPNVLPDLDLGVRKGVQRVYGLRRLPTPQQVQSRGAIWSPFASVAAWYMWRSLELPDENGAPARRRRVAPAARGKPRAAKTTRAKRSSPKRARAKSRARPDSARPNSKRAATKKRVRRAT